jgi:alcohol dehydrogenase class IV
MTTDPGVYKFLAQERIVFGEPVAESVVAEADLRGAGRVMIVASKTLNRQTDVIETIRAALGERHAGTYDGTVEHVPRTGVLDLAAEARALNPDLIVTVGGGTPIDTVKVALVCLAEGLTEPAQLSDFHLRVRDDGGLHVPAVGAPPVRQIIVPTTLSGAEFSNIGASVDTETEIKHLYSGREICGEAVILDPAITVHTPEWLWLSTGMRAVDHAVESICSKQPQPYTDATSLHGLGMLATALRGNRERPDDLGARLDAQVGVWLASTGLGRIPWGASHGIGHQLGAVANVPHGHCSCVMLPSVLRYNKPVNAARQERVSRAMGRPDMEAADAVAELVADLGQPTRLRDVGITRDQFDAIANGSIGNVFVSQNPRPISEPAQILEILEMAW